MEANYALILTIALLALARGTDGVGLSETSTTEDFEHSEVLDSHGNYKLYWNFNRTHVTFEVHVRTTGWVGFGISDNGNMFPSDVVIGWVDSTGTTHFSDRHASAHRMPLLDKSQDWFLLYGAQGDFGTVLKFQREIDTCDPQDTVIPENTVRIIYAYNAADPVSDDVINYHGASSRGTKSVSILSAFNVPKNLPSDVKLYDFRNHNFLMPSAATTYNCVGFKMAALGKHHMIRFEPVITPGNELHVHHILLYRCHVQNPDAGDGVNGNCYNNRPSKLPHCENMVLAWAVGGGAFYFPDSVGYSIGGPDDPNFYVMETHYDNPDMRSDVIDNSGIRITMTPTLRPIETGLLMIGDSVSYSQMIPPNRQNYVTNGMCSEGCLESNMMKVNVSEINVFAALQHSHLIGREIRTRHFRNGTEVEPIMDDQNYDFNFQQTRQLPNIVKIYPGDSLSVDCVYDSTSRPGITFGGLSTKDEMCLTFLYYYPKLPAINCGSRQTYDALGFADQGDIYRALVGIDWTNQTEVTYYEDKVAQSTVIEECFDEGSYIYSYTDLDTTMFRKPFVHPQPQCIHRK